MKMSVTIDKSDVENFNLSIDKLFDDIQFLVSHPPMYQDVINKAQKGMHENKLALKNSGGWESVKAKLKKDGKIKYKEPLNVTGQLVDDFYAQTLNTSPGNLEELGVWLTFKDIPRIRPTIKSMYVASKDEAAKLEYELISSYRVALKLEKYTGTINGVQYNITDALYGLYSKDAEKVVFGAVARAFEKNK